MQSQLRKEVLEQAEDSQGSSAEEELTCPGSHGWAVEILPMTHTGSCVTDEGSRLSSSAEPPLLGEAFSFPWEVIKKPPDRYQRCRSWISSPTMSSGCEPCPLPCQHPSWLQHLEASPSVWGNTRGHQVFPDLHPHCCLYWMSKHTAVCHRDRGRLLAHSETDAGVEQSHTMKSF